MVVITKTSARNENSAYRTLSRSLAQDILQGVYPENAKLPTERKLCEMYNVSRITVRQALSILENDGIIAKHQGRGTFVRPRNYAQNLSSIYSFTEELIKMNSVPGNRVLSCKIVPADKKIAETLSLPEEAPVCEVCRLRLADGEPFAFETSYIPVEFIGNTTVGEIEHNGLYATIRAYCGAVPDGATEVFEATLAPREVALNLKREGKFAVMRVLRTASCRGRKMEYCITYLAGDKYRYSVELPMRK